MPTRLEVERELEWRRIRRDPAYFLNKYWNIETIGKGYEVSGLRTYQEAEVGRWVEAAKGDRKDHQVRLKARQIGFTTIAEGFAFHNAYFNQNHPWLTAQQSEDEAKKTLASKVKVPYLMLPAWIRDRGPKLLTDNTEQMVFDNGSSISAIHSGASAARSRAVYGTIMDEAAFMEDPDALFGALDPLTYGLFLMFSTANGMDSFFFEICQDAQLPDSEWEFGFYPWSEVPNRDDSWYASTQRRYRTQPWLFYQEYPATPAEAFAKSGKTAFDPEFLEETQPFCMPDIRYDISLLDIYGTQRVDIEEQLRLAEIPDGEDRDMELWVWEHPFTERDDDGVLLRKPNFVVSADISEGLDDGDYSSITVMDANSMEEVASVVAHIPYEDIGPLMEWIGYWYYSALVGPERNNQGLVPLQYLQQAGYPRIYRMDTIAQQKRGDRTPRYGWHTNKATKPKMVIDAQKEFRAEAVTLRDPRFLAEARTFLHDGKGGYGASSKHHDDKVMSVLIAIQLCLDVGEYPIVWEDRSPKPVTMDDMFGHLMPKRGGRSPLYQPIGQPHREKPVKEGIWLMPQNTR